MLEPSRRLNVGCGLFPLPYWTNLDADPTIPADVHADASDYLATLAEDSLDDIYAGHFLEHLGYDEARAFLSECYRVLAPGGRLAVVVPDTREILTRWLAGSIDAVEYPDDVWWSLNDLDSVCHLFLYSDVQPSPHKWAWERNTLARAMTQAGFSQLQELDRYRDPRLGGGAWYQCGVQGVKARFIEARVMDDAMDPRR
jgi:predicted SAM-dependent methyltransferase